MMCHAWMTGAMILCVAITLSYGARLPRHVKRETDECFRTSYTHGQVWLQYKSNCHQYIVCEPRGPGKYIKHMMSCGDLYWNQKWHACTGEKTGDCEDVSEDTTTEPTTTTPAWTCPYKQVPNTPSVFYSVADETQVQACAKGQEFSDEHCTCLVVPGSAEAPSCSNDLLLHFANDTTGFTCNHAKAFLYGTGTVTLAYDPAQKRHVAKFSNGGYVEVPFIRTWFANNHVDAFSLSLWFNRQGLEDAIHGPLINNGDSVEKPSFSLRATINSKLVATIRTENGEKEVTVTMSGTSHGWHHVAYVYDGATLTITVDNKAVNSEAITGYMVNTDVPMLIAFEDGKYFFEGLMNELRVYDRALSPSEIAVLYLDLLPK